MQAGRGAPDLTFREQPGEGVKEHAAPRPIALASGPEMTVIGVVDVAAATPWWVKIGGGCPQTPVMLGAAEPA